jgi:serine/threonine protein kinase
MSRDEVRHKPLGIGDILDGRYELRSDLGRGASGLVFEARHRFTDRRVALKVLAPDVPRGQLIELRARLQREARALSAARHPGIVEVLDGGVTDDGTPYLVMEKLEGRSLEGLLAARGRITPEETVTLTIQLCEALAVAHRAGVVHRDLKPDHIFVVREPDGLERVKIVDFGIAQVRRTTDDRLTGIGALIGTPAYMAPEQLLALQDVDCRVDIYALGVSMFECLTGRVPYEGNYQRVLLKACSPDEQADTRPLLEAAGEELAGIVTRAFAREPGARFATVVELATALHAARPTAPARTLFLGPPPLPLFAPAKPSAASQRRRTPRAPYVTPVHIALTAGSVEGRTEDVSEGGLLVITRQPCEANQRATVRFALPIEGRVVSSAVQLRWVRAARPEDPEGPRAIGAEFVEAPAEVRASIARYVELMGEPGREA